MCGIIGYSGRDDIHISDLKSMLLMAQIRGRDSTGVASPDRTTKKASSATEFITRKDIPVGRNVLGHTRAKTTGKICDRNAHPFIEGGVVGVHNGYIGNYSSIATKESIKGVQVDSEVIWHLVNKYGIEGSIPKMRGSFALGWLDDMDRLNLYRHKNPISYGFKNDGFYFGSSGSYLETIGCTDIVSLDEHKHIIVDEGEIVEENDLSNIEPKKYSSRSSVGYGHTQQYRRDRSKKTKSIRDQYPPQHAPLGCNYINTKKGHILYYWFLNSSYTELAVEPVYSGINHDWKEIYSLDNESDVASLESQFIEIYNVDEVQEIIETHK